MAEFRDSRGRLTDGTQAAPQPKHRPRVRAGRFGSLQGASTSYDPAARLAQISADWAKNPGRSPRGSGSTGLLANDAGGWRDMLATQREYASLQDYMDGGTGELDVRHVGSAFDPYSVGQAPLGSGFDPATGEDNADAFGLNAGIGGAQLAADKKKLAPDAFQGILAASKRRQF